MKVNTLMERKMAKEFINGLVAQPTKVNLKREKCVDKEFIFMRMVKNIKETLRIINLMDKESITGQVAKDSLVNINKAKDKKELLHFKMEESLKVVLNLVKNMVNGF